MANVLVKIRSKPGTFVYGWLDEVISAGISHAGPFKVKRRMWRFASQDADAWESREAALRHGQQPVQAVIGWCPALGKHPDRPESLEPHGRVVGLNETRPSKKYGHGVCLRCAANTQDQVDTRKKIAWLRSGGKV